LYPFYDVEQANQVDEHGVTVLHRAVRKGLTHIVQLLISYKADVNVQMPSQDGGYCPLHLAAQTDNWQAAEVLIEARADPNQVAQYHSSPLHEAAKKGGISVTRLLITNGADALQFDSFGQCAHFYANKRGKTEMAAILPLVNVNMWSHFRERANFTEMVESVKAEVARKSKKKGKGKKAKNKGKR